MRKSACTGLAAGLTAAIVPMAIGCDDLLANLGGSCSEQRVGYESAVTSAGQLRENVASEGAMAMAVVISQPALNSLLSKTGAINLAPIRHESPDWGRLRITPSLPALSIEAITDCPTCILADTTFDLWLDVSGVGQFDGSVSVKAGVPVSLTSISDRKTGLIAGLSNVQIAGVSIAVEGYDTSDIPGLDGLLGELAETFLEGEVGDRTLTKLDSFRVGEGVLLAARGPTISTASRTIVLGMHSNLMTSQTASVEAQAELPAGIDVALQLHPELLHLLANRLVFEDEIPQSYDADGNADPLGDDHVLLTSMQTTEGGLLHTGLQVWRTGGNACGVLDVVSDLGLAVTAQGITLEAQNFEVVGGQGAGEIIAEASWLAGDFLGALTDNLELTVNWADVGLGTSADEPAGLAPSGLFVDGRGITVQLNIAD